MLKNLPVLYGSSMYEETVELVVVSEGKVEDEEEWEDEDDEDLKVQRSYLQKTEIGCLSLGVDGKTGSFRLNMKEELE